MTKRRTGSRTITRVDFTIDVTWPDMEGDAAGKATRASVDAATRAFRQTFTREVNKRKGIVTDTKIKDGL